MATHIGTTINESPVIVRPAAVDIEAARGIALALDSDGNFALPTAGANVVGISLMTTDEKVATGDDITVQIKDIGKWVAGAEITPGTELTTDAEGKAVPATTGNFITAIALSGATSAGTLVKCQIVKAGYKA